jgi:glutamine synthetase
LQTKTHVRRVIRERHIEFLFAQFVDMHGKASAKLVPAHHIDDLLAEGAGFAWRTTRNGDYSTTTPRSSAASGRRRSRSPSASWITTCSCTNLEWDRHEEHRSRL